MLMKSFAVPLQSQTLLQNQMFGFSTLRKRLGLYSFKLTKNRVYKNPHAMSLRKRQDLQKQGYEGELKIRETERLSERPFGSHTRKGRFVLDIEKVPFFNIPDLTGFNLKPYVSHATAKIDPRKLRTEKGRCDTRFASVNRRNDQKCSQRESLSKLRGGQGSWLQTSLI